MAIGIQRFNDPKVQPNSRITFITAMKEYEDHEQAQKILEGLAAQFKPIMKQWHLSVTNLVEHEYNTQFAGRNWNAGERIEMVLRRPDGSFAPYKFLLHVFAHELAHIKEMNHARDFQKINKQLREACDALRSNHYYGDGFWSNGRSLKYDNAQVPYDPEERPMFVCAGANTTKRKQRRVRITDQSRAERGAAKLGKTGRQTAIPRKAGSRVTKKNAFVGEGNVLSDDPTMSTYKRQAGSRSAVEARAIAAEERMKKEKREREAAENKIKVKSEVKDEIKHEEDQLESEGEGEAEEEGWEYEDPRVDLSDDEKGFLKDEMEHWDDDLQNGSTSASGSDSGLGPKSKGKRKSTPIKKHYHSSDSDSDPAPPSKKSKSKIPTSSSSRNGGSKVSPPPTKSSRKSKTPTVVVKKEPSAVIVIDSDSD